MGQCISVVYENKKCHYKNYGIHECKNNIDLTCYIIQIHDNNTVHKLTITNKYCDEHIHMCSKNISLHDVANLPILKLFITLYKHELLNNIPFNISIVSEVIDIFDNEKEKLHEKAIEDARFIRKLKSYNRLKNIYPNGEICIQGCFISELSTPEENEMFELMKQSMCLFI